MRKFIWKLVIIFAVVGALFVFILQESVTETKIGDGPGKLTIRDAVLEVEFAITRAAQIKGLSGRESLEEGRGMLFVYDNPGYYSIWMKNMNFPIDIVWFDRNWQVVDIKKNALPESYPEAFTPRAPSQYILEVGAGWAAEHDITIGNTAKLEVL